MRLLNINQNTKTVKNLNKGHLTGILYLKPCKILCPACSKGCMKSCLFSAGRGIFSSIQKVRQRKTLLYLKNLERFKRNLWCDIEDLVDMAEQKGLKPSVRINGTSDIDVVDKFKDLLEAFPQVQFYDYTKRLDLVFKERPKNYHITFSRSEKTSDETIQEVLTSGVNVAIVFDEVPKAWKGIPVVDGDETDLRFLDPSGVIVGLKAKGKAKQDTTGFVWRTK